MATKKKPTPTKAVEVQEVRNAVVVEKVSNLSIDAMASKIGSLQVEAQKKLAEVGTLVTGALQTYSEVQQAIDVKKVELKTLYGIETGAINLDELKAEAEQAAHDIAAAREAHAADAAERERALAEKRKRDEVEHQYATGIQRRKETDDFKEKMEADRKQFKAEVDTANKHLNDRAAGLTAAEKELTDLRAQVAGFDGVLKAAVAKAEAVVGNTVKRDYETKLSLLQKDMETAKLVADSQQKAADAANATLRAENARMQDEVKRAQADMKDVSVKALEAGSKPTVFQMPQQNSDPQQNGRQR
jgi:colicin import membrane protein